MTSFTQTAPISVLPMSPLHEQISDLPQISSSTLSSTTGITSTATSPVHSGPVTATLNFYSPPADGSPPHNYVEKQTDGTPQRNFGEDAQSIQLNDGRGHEQEFTLDSAAFALLKNHPHNPAIDWSSDESIKTHYYPEVERLLLDACSPGATRIILFDHTVRRAAPDAHRAPVTRAHIDQTPKSAAMRVKLHVDDAEEAEELLAGRYRIINVWRPLNGAVESFPLAFADSATVADADMVAVEHRYPDRTGETAGVKFSKGHKWWYWSGVDDDERVLLQCFDSRSPMNRVPHSAFVDPRSGDGAKPRQSIEVRALVFG